MSTSFSYYHYRSLDSIAQGAGTNSKRPESYVMGCYPTHANNANGAVIESVDGKKYTDYVCSLGVNFFGHSNLHILRAIKEAFCRGSVYSIGSTYEVIAAEKLKALVPFIDKVKWLKTGTEACAAAVRIAKSYTKRDKILVEGYHGWSDCFMDTPPARGVSDNSTIDTFRGIDSKTFEMLSNEEFACVILEPVETDYSTERKKWLQSLREVCDKTGTILIFDEVITGMRWKNFCVAKDWGITPDLICFGKALGGGLPLSCVAGKKHLMDDKEYFVSSTFSGDNLALSAFIKASELLVETEYNIDNLWLQGKKFTKLFNSLHENLQIVGYPTRGVFRGDLKIRDLFFQEAALAGLIFGPSWFFNFSLIEHTDATISLCADIMNEIKAGRVSFKGQRPQSPFASQQRKS